MVDTVITVKLQRGEGTSWGFRLAGGKDFGYPLSVQRVSGIFLPTFLSGKLFVVVRYLTRPPTFLSNGTKGQTEAACLPPIRERRRPSLAFVFPA